MEIGAIRCGFAECEVLVWGVEGKKNPGDLGGAPGHELVLGGAVVVPGPWLFQRVFLEEVADVVEGGAGADGVADFFDFVGADGRGLIAEAIADEGEDGGDFVVFEETAEGSHGDGAVVFFAIEFERAHEAEEGGFDETVRFAGDPRAFGEGREGWVEALAVGLVAGGAVGVAEVDLLAGEVLFFVFVAEVSGSWEDRVFCDDEFGQAGEAVAGGAGGVGAPFVEREGGGGGDDFAG